MRCLSGKVHYQMFEWQSGPSDIWKLKWSMKQLSDKVDFQMFEW